MKKRALVIGSGLGGTLICNELVERYDVTLLEVGEKDRIAYPRVEFIKKNFGAVKTFCIGQGGTTNLWDNGLIPINSSDISSGRFHQVLDVAKPYIDRAAGKLYFGKRRYSVEYNSRLAEMTQISNNIGFSDGVDCLLYPKKHRRLSVDHRVEANYAVRDIRFTIENDRIASVRFVVEGQQCIVSPDMVVISAGALGTPAVVNRILSFGGYPCGQPGLGLADHPMGFIGKIKVKKQFQSRFEKMAYFDKGNYVCRTAVRLKSDCGRYTCCAFFRPALTMQNRLSIHKYKSLLGASGGKDRLRAAFSLKILHPDILAEIYSHLFGVQVRSRIFHLLLLFEQKRGKSRVYYRDGTITVDWGVTDEELGVYNRILKKLKNMLKPLADELNFQIPITKDWLWSAAHHSGTISLGDSPGDLIDKNLKLNGIENAFVCDGSVIQEHSYANTGLTIGQLAMRLADHLSN